MDFELSEEQKLLKASARGFMDKEIIPLVNDWERKYRPLPKDVAINIMKKIAPLGYTGGMVPVEWGGGGMNFVSYGVLIEELSRAWGSLSIMVVVHHGGALDLSRSGTEEQKKRYLPLLVSGNVIASGAITEPNAGSSNREMETTIVCDGDYYIVNGTKTWITNGGVSDFCAVVGYTDKSKGAKGISRIIVDGTESPFEARELPKLGFRSCPTAELTFSDCRVPKRNLIGQEGAGYEATMVAFLFPRAMIGISSAGLAQAAIEDAAKYALERRQFGKPIAKFQLVQQMLAEMVVETEAIRLLAYKACHLLDKGEVCFKECSGIKFFGSETAVRVCSTAMEVLGAYGISEEYPLERYFRDARTLLPPDGTNQIQRLIVGREVFGMPAFV
ncbi:MAG: acyl-CoA dehydrogenase [Chloroflexi bacterium]|nr:acyl-CoA dehydrogenase [Chloroflexota bacterium]